MEAEIEKWGRENYPRLMDNQKLIESLYRKKVLNQPTMIAQATAYPLVKVNTLQPAKVVSLIITKVESNIRELQVCRECNRAKCTHDVGKVAFYVCRMVAGDDTAMENFERVSTNKDLIDVIDKNEEFLVSGSLKVDEKYGRSFSIKSAAPLTKEQIAAWERLEEYNSIHGGEAGLSEEEFENATKLNKELLHPFFERVFISRQNGRVKW
jgi:hypothetical protein